MKSDEISVNLHQPYRLSRWGRMAYLWSARNSYLADYGLRVLRSSPEPADIVAITAPHVPDREPWAHKDYRNYLTAVPGEPFEYRDTPMICESAMDYAYIDDTCRSLLSHPQVRAFTTGSRYREEEPQLRGTWGGDYYAAVYRRRLLFEMGPDPQRRREPLSAELQAKHKPLCRPPSEPFRDDVFEYILAKKRPLRDRPMDVFFCGRVQYHPSRSINSVTDHRWRAIEAIERLPVKNKVCIPYSDHDGRVWWGKPVRSFKYPFEYCDALLASKVVVSPWGWSPWAIRDCEALACGCVVVKPECSNLVIIPDIYDPKKCLLVWCDLLFENLEDRVMYILGHLDEFQDRADRGHKLVLDTLYPNAKVFATWTAAMRKMCEEALSGPAFAAAASFLS